MPSDEKEPAKGSDRPKPDGTHGIVVSVSNDGHQAVINRGSDNGVKVGHRYLIYRVATEPLVDPETGDDLGFLETVRGTGVVVHVQPRLATIQSDRTEKSVRRVIQRPSPAFHSLYQLGLWEREEVENLPAKEIPFDNALRGDRAKRVG